MLIDDKGQACLTDFGLSSMVKIGERFNYLRLHEKHPGAVCSLAPELMDEDQEQKSVGCSVNHEGVGKRYIPSPSSDIYSYGCIMFEVSLSEVKKVDYTDGCDRFFPVLPLG